MKDFKETKTITSAGTTYSKAFDYGSADVTNIEVLMDVTAHNGGDVTLNVTPQISYDGGSTWIDGPTAFDQVVAVTKQILKLVTIGLQMRFKYTLAGTAPSATFSLYAVAR